MKIHNGDTTAMLRKDGNWDLRYKEGRKQASLEKSKQIINKDIKKPKVRKAVKRTFWQRLKRRFLITISVISIISVTHTGHTVYAKIQDIRTANRIKYEESIIRPVKASGIGTGEVLNGQEKQLPASVSEKIHAYSDWDADLMEAIARWESSGWACDLVEDARNDDMNKDGSKDIGLFQINSNTFKDFQNRYGNEVKDLGISTYDQLLDVDKNISFAHLVWQEQGYRAWVGYTQGLWQTCWGSVGK
jgi:hypothetical protein